MAKITALEFKTSCGLVEYLFKFVLDPVFMLFVSIFDFRATKGV